MDKKDGKDLNATVVLNFIGAVVTLYAAGVAIYVLFL